MEIRVAPLYSKPIVECFIRPPELRSLSQAVRVNDSLYISGQVGVDLETGELAGGLEEQAELIFVYLVEILTAAGAGMDIL